LLVGSFWMLGLYLANRESLTGRYLLINKLEPTLPGPKHCRWSKIVCTIVLSVVTSSWLRLSMKL